MPKAKTTLLVASDLHLGGDVGFEMCSKAGQERLSQFFTWAGTLIDPQMDIQLVLAGDVVDFLAEKDSTGDWSAFTANPEMACRKLERIFNHTEPVWDALKGAVFKGVALTILLGNHDIELSLPLVRSRLLERIGPGRIEFIYDNEAHQVGPVLIEHGNRYDSWNVVAHDSLRQVRSRISRREQVEGFPVQPGSELVVRVMNRIKESYPFIDLLKPETGAALPILGVLAPSVVLKAWPFLYAAARAAWRGTQYDAFRQPTELDFVSARREDARPRAEDDTDRRAKDEVSQGRVPLDDFPDRASFEEALKLARSAEEEQGSGKISWSARVSVKLLLDALRWWCGKSNITWEVEQETKEYKVPAEMLASRGVRVVVFGHTHLAKHVALENGAVYLNTGTWADLIRLPQQLITGEKSAALKLLEKLLEDLRQGRLEPWRRPVPTFARIELEAGAVCSSGVFFFDGPGRIPPVSTDGLIERLELK